MATDFTIADVLAWARTKPADERYDFLQSNNCAVAQFGRETGREYLIGVGNLDVYSPEVRKAACSLTGGWTFGALVNRLEALGAAETISDTWTKAEAYAHESVSA